MSRSRAKSIGLAGDVVARHALAEADRAVGEHAADDDVVGLGADVAGVLDLPLERDADVPGFEFDDPHAECLRYRATMPTA